MRLFPINTTTRIRECVNCLNVGITASRIGIIAGTVIFVGAFWLCDMPAQSFTAPRDATTGISSGSPTMARASGNASLGIQGDATLLAPAEIISRMLEKNKQRLVALEHYESERTYRVEYTGTGGEHHAEMHVHAEYTGPDQKRLTILSESGSKFLCEKVLRKLVEGEQEATVRSNRTQTTLDPKNYDTQLLGEEVLATQGGPIHTWKLHVTPKENNKFTYRGKVWVSKDDYAIVRIQAEPTKNPSFWINRASFESMYVRRGEVWLPETNISHGHIRLGGDATMTIVYGTYPVVVQHALKPSVESVEDGSRTVALRQ